MTVTQKDIAKKLNVSVMTVSKALKGHPDISQKTRKRVEKTARQMNYSVNVVARSLVQKRTNTIGVIVPDISESFYAEMLRGIESNLREQQYNIILADSDNDAKIEMQALHMMQEKRIDGLLFAPSEKSDKYIPFLQNLAIPFVLINRGSSKLKCDLIKVDRSTGAFHAVSHLLSNGYKDIYFFYTFQHMAECTESISGCYQALESFNIEKNQLGLVHCTNRNLVTFYRKTKEKIHFSGRKIGIFVWDDEMTIAVNRALVEMGLTIPDQVGLVGFDDISISKYLTKALTTIHYPKYEMGQKAAQRLLERLKSEKKYPPCTIELKLNLIVRETT